MRDPSPFRIGLFVVALSICLVSLAHASTTVLYAQLKGQWKPVVKVVDNVPFVFENGRIVRADPNLYAQRTINHYPKGMPPPVIIQVEKMQLGSQGIYFIGETNLINNEFDITATITAPVDLHNVFVVFELTGERGDKTLLVREVGELKPGIPDFFVYHEQLEGQMGAFRYSVRFYSNGIELFYPRQGWGYINGEVARHIEAETEGIQNSNPRPYVMTPPEVPESVKKAGVRKIVDVVATILPNGSVPEAHAVPGTPAELAAPAQTAIEMSYFLPKITHGEPVTCKVKIPVVLDPKSEL